MDFFLESGVEKKRKSFFFFSLLYLKVLDSAFCFSFVFGSQIILLPSLNSCFKKEMHVSGALLEGLAQVRSL